MALSCDNCWKGVGDSEGELPGNEAVWIHPKIPVLIWNPDNEGPRWFLHSLAQAFNRCLCFECIEKAISEERKVLLGKIYDSLNAEWLYEELNESRMGQWIDSRRDRDYLNELNQASGSFKVKWEEANLGERCLFCGCDLSREPFSFLAITISRIKSTKYRSYFTGQMTYNIGGTKGCVTKFRLCRLCFNGNFPETFRKFSFDLRDVEDPEKQSQKKSELYIGETALDEILDTLDPEIIKEVASKFGSVKVVRQWPPIAPKEGPNK